ncbi:glycosyltransferase family 4 protein [Coleofasciculus sp. FACHB-64]|uniref:glycosyltransferase n=1 Tax=Coleofasciculus sp. FACHB-64 TaxID=2692788 RepID=UPI001A7EC582
MFDRPFYPVRGGAEARALDHLDYFHSRGIKYDLFLIDRFYNYSQWNDTGILYLVNSRAESIFIHEVLGKDIDSLYYKWLSRFYRISNQVPDVASIIHALPNMIRKFRKIVKKNSYDFIFFNHTYVSNALIEGAGIPFCKTYIDTHDIYSNLIKEVIALQSLDLRIKSSGSKIQRSIRKKVPKFDYEASLNKEIKLLKKFDQIITISYEELEILSQYPDISEKLSLIPKASASSLKANPSINTQNSIIDITTWNKFDILFFGSQYDPNVHGISQFYFNVLPLLSPNVKLIIAGGVSLKLDFITNPQVTLLGFVDDIDKLYSSVEAVILPIFYGSGVSIKAVEALSYGKPVISTPQGVRGLAVKTDLDVLIAQDIYDFAPLIEKLRLDSDLQQRLRKSAFEYTQRENSKQRIYAKMDCLF